MKRNFILSAMLLISTMLFAQSVVSSQDQLGEAKPVITFEKTEHNFGKINEADGRVTTVFEFTNNGTAPLVLTNVKASCGCTTPKWTKTPIEPGKSGTIEVTYNPNGRPGNFSKTITVTSNATEPTVRIYIKGEVIPKSAKPVDKYPVKMGNLSLASTNAHFGTVLKGNNATKTIEYTNTTAQDVTVSVRLVKDNDPIMASATVETVKPNEVGKIELIFRGDLCKNYGPLSYDMYIIVDGEGFGKEDHKITAKVNVEEDFSKLTAEQKQNAPILEVAQEINLGVINPGKEVKKTFTVKNVGVDPMFVRCIINNNESLFRTVAPTKGIKAGKTGTVTIKIDGMNGEAKCTPGAYRRSISIITNDPKTPKKNVVIVWTVE